MPGIVPSADLPRSLERLTVRVERLERRRRDVGTPTPNEACVCPDNEGFVSGGDTGVTLSGTSESPTWSFSTSIGTGIFANSGDIETTESGLYAINASLSINAGTTTIPVIGMRIHDNSQPVVLATELRAGTTGALSPLPGSFKENAISIGGVFPLPAQARIDVDIQASPGVAFDYTATLWVVQVNRFPAV